MTSDTGLVGPPEKVALFMAGTPAARRPLGCGPKRIKNYYRCPEHDTDRELKCCEHHGIAHCSSRPHLKSEGGFDGRITMPDGTRRAWRLQ